MPELNRQHIGEYALPNFFSSNNLFCSRPYSLLNKNIRASVETLIGLLSTNLAGDLLGTIFDLRYSSLRLIAEIFSEFRAERQDRPNGDNHLRQPHPSLVTRIDLFVSQTSIFSCHKYHPFFHRSIMANVGIAKKETQSFL